MTRSVKVGDRVKSKVYGHGVIKYDGYKLVGVRFNSGSYRAYRKDDWSSTLKDDSIEFIQPIKVGDTVTLIDNFYEHEKFKAEPRDQRKDIDKLKGRVFKFIKISILGDRAIHDTECRWSIPLELLRKVDDGINAEWIATGTVDDGVIKGTVEPKKGDLFRVIGNTTPHHYYKIGDVVEFCQLLKNGNYACISVESQRYQHISPCDLEPYDGIHRHTPEQIAEAQRIIGEIVAGFKEGECFYIRDESKKEFTIRYTSETADCMHTIAAHCSPHDEFNRTIGLLVALCKATGRKLPDWV